MKRVTWILPAALIASMAYAQDASKPAETPAGAEAKSILQKTLAAYSAAKTYQGAWSFTIERGASKNTVAMDIKAKSPAKLYFRVAPAAPQKPVPGQEPIPELLVVLDGKAAYFQNSSSAVYYKVPLPKDARVSPLMFVPQIPAASQVELREDKQADGKTLHVLEAATIDGGITRMEIAADGFRIRRIVAEKFLGSMKETSTITVDKETFDGEVSDREFSFKPPKNAKEIVAPPGSDAIFGPPAAAAKP